MLLPKIKIDIKKILLSAFVLRIILVFISQSHPDILNHVDWGNRLLELGPYKFYENIFWGVSWPNQPFASMYLFALIKLVRDLIFNIFLFLNNQFSLFPSFVIPVLEQNLQIWLLKLPFILADLGIAFFVYKFLTERKNKHALLAAIMFLFNPIVIYNSTIWGQTDSLINLLILAGFYFVYKKHYFLGIFLTLISFTFKLSLIIYLPLFLILLWKRRNDWKKILFSFLFTFVTIVLLAWPFSIYPNPLKWLLYLYQNRVLPRQGNMLNGNAFNSWFILYGPDFSLSDSLPLLGIAAKKISYAFTIIVLFFIYLKIFIRKSTSTDFIFALFLTAFTAFLFLTNMHERYLYPIFPLFSLLIFLIPKYFNLKHLVIISFIHLLNLYNLWFYPLITPLKSILIFSDFLVCKILSIILLVYYVKYLYAYFKKSY